MKNVRLLFFVSFGLNLIFSLLDPFLHDWDERFHALVARNMAANPFKPMLRAHPLIPFNRFDWCGNHIWLHKQPLFLWQMALSMKLFGYSEFALRLPSVLMGAGMVLLIYDLARRIFRSNTWALVAASLLCVNNYHLKLISGLEGTDHNNVAFGFYVLLSLWLYAVYLQRRLRYLAILVGLAAGMAVLNKWLPGLVVLGTWGMYLMLNGKTQLNRSAVFDWVVALLVALIVFLPWQVYIMSSFPAEAKYEYNYNTRHIAEALEGHTGTMLFYIRQMPRYYGWLGCMLLPVGIFALLKNR